MQNYECPLGAPNGKGIVVRLPAGNFVDAYAASTDSVVLKSSGTTEDFARVW